MSSARAVLEGGDQLLHVLFGLGREVFLYPVLADGFAEGAIGGGRAALPAGGLFGLAVEGLLEEVETGIFKGLGEPRRNAIQDVEFEVGLESVEALVGDDLASPP
jgi:hypothetical protein